MRPLEIFGFDDALDLGVSGIGRVENMDARGALAGNDQVVALEAAIERDSTAPAETPLAAEAAEVAPEALDESPSGEASPSDDKAAKPSADKKSPDQH